MLITLLILHWIADFLLQDDKTAINKSKDVRVLIEHSALYSGIAIIFWAIFIMNDFVIVGKIVLYLFSTHFLVDFFTSKWTAYLYPKSRHWFFVVIGLDQLLHQLTLIGLVACLNHHIL